MVCAHPLEEVERQAVEGLARLLFESSLTRSGSAFLFGLPAQLRLELAGIQFAHTRVPPAR